MFKSGNQYGKKSKRGKSIDKELKERLKKLANGLIDDISKDDLTKSQKVSLLKGLLPYLMPKEVAREEVEEIELKAPAVIVFGDTKEYQAYNAMTEEEQDKMLEEASPLF